MSSPPPTSRFGTSLSSSSNARLTSPRDLFTSERLPLLPSTSSAMHGSRFLNPRTSDDRQLAASRSWLLVIVHDILPATRSSSASGVLACAARQCQSLHQHKTFLQLHLHASASHGRSSWSVNPALSSGSGLLVRHRRASRCKDLVDGARRRLLRRKKNLYAGGGVSTSRGGRFIRSSTLRPRPLRLPPRLRPGCRHPMVFAVTTPSNGSPSSAGLDRSLSSATSCSPISRIPWTDMLSCLPGRRSA